MIQEKKCCFFRLTHEFKSISIPIFIKSRDSGTLNC